jgi:GNAT superfamily N-acetyltransferase
VKWSCGAEVKGDPLGSCYDEVTVDDFRVGLFCEDDSIEALTNLLHRSYKELADMGFQYLATHQSPAITLDRILKGECYVAKLGDTLVGTITFENAVQTSGCRWYDRSDVASFHQFAVAREHQRHGLGSLLLDVVERRALETGAHEIACDTAEGARHLVSLYERRGYRFIENVQWDVTNYRSVILSKSLFKLS